MALTSEQRAEINRQNAARSTGPKTDEGKASSRRNAIKHGLRAEALPLPNEDPAVVAARSEAWNDYYRPQSPAAQHMVNACVAATLLSDRCQKYHAASLEKQVRDAGFVWEVDRQEAVDALVVMLKTDPARAARKLTRTGHGCRWLIETWERLTKALDERGWWTGPERDLAIRVQGFSPEGDKIKECPEAWVTRLFALLCHEDPGGVAVAWLFQSHRLPDLYRGDYRPDSLPFREEALESLRALAAERLADARRTEAAHQEFFDDPDLAGAADRALILHDGPTARLFLRYHAEARTSFHRAYGSLTRTLELDAADGPAPVDSPIEAPAPCPATPSEAVSPNEADLVAKPGESETSADPIGVEPVPEAPTQSVETRPQPARFEVETIEQDFNAVIEGGEGQLVSVARPALN